MTSGRSPEVTRYLSLSGIGKLSVRREGSYLILLTLKRKKFAYWELVSRILKRLTRQDPSFDLITYDLLQKQACYRK